MSANRSRSGFSLVETAIVVAIIAILLAFIAVALNPGKRFAASRNTVRLQDVAAIADAVSISVAKGARLASVGKVMRMIGTATTGCSRRCGDLDGMSEGFAFDNSHSYGTGGDPTYFRAVSNTVTGLNLSGQRTYSAWVKTKSTNSWNGILSKYGGGGGYGIFSGYEMYYDANTGFIRVLDFLVPADLVLINQLMLTKRANVAMAFSTFPTRVEIVSTTDYPIITGQYQHLAMTFDDSGGAPVFRFFVDGVEHPTAKTQSFAMNTTTHRGTAGNFAIGSMTAGFTIGADAKIDDVGVYSRVLTNAEITALSDGDDVTSDRVAFWEFNEGTGPTADSTPSDPNLRLQMSAVATQQGIVHKLWDDDEPLLPASCVNLDLTKTPGRLPRMPRAPMVPGGKFVPDAARTFYAVSRGVSVTARSCLSEADNADGSVTQGPVIEVSR